MAVDVMVYHQEHGCNHDQIVIIASMGGEEIRRRWVDISVL